MDGSATVDEATGGNPEITQRSGSARAALVVAILTISLWYVIVMLARPDFVGDEQYHVPTIRSLLAGDWGPARQRSVPPTFHVIASLPARVFGDSLWVIRGFNALLAVAAVILYNAAAKVRHANDDGSRLLQFAWNPLLMPFWVLAYTDLGSLLAVIVALNFHVRRRHALAAAGLLVACLIRQSNVVWVVLFAVLGVVDQIDPATITRPASVTRDRIRRATPIILPYVLAFAVWAGLSLFTSVLKVLPRTENGPRPNPAQFYVFALTAALLWAPVWIGKFARLWPRRFERALLRPWVCAAVIAAVGLLAVAFRNPHPWNLDLDYLRNWLLHALTNWGWARWLAAVCIVAFVTTLARATWRDAYRRTLLIVWGVVLLFLLPHYLVDPRYYMVPIVLLDFFTARTPGQSGRLAVWYLLLSIAFACVFASWQRSAVGGVW